MISSSAADFDDDDATVATGSTTATFGTAAGFDDDVAATSDSI